MLALLVAAITVLPALALWVVGVLVSPSLRVAVDTWDLPLKTIAASAALAVPTVLLALAYSSVTAESRIASFAWFATWAACWIAHSTLTTADMVAAVQRADAVDAGGERTAAAGRGGSWNEDPFDDLAEEGGPPPGRRARPGRSMAPGGPGRTFHWLAKAAGMDPAIDRWAWLSPYHALSVVQAWIFGMETRPEAILPPLTMLVIVSVGAVLVMLDRIEAPTRV